MPHNNNTIEAADTKASSKLRFADIKTTPSAPTGKIARFSNFLKTLFNR